MQRLSTRDADFAQRFAALVADTREGDRGVSEQVARILERVKREGFAAVADLTERFDRVHLTAGSAEVSATERAAPLIPCAASAHSAGSDCGSSNRDHSSAD